MLQIDHIYEFFYQEIFKDFSVWHLVNGTTKKGSISWEDVNTPDFETQVNNEFKIFFYDQEPLLPTLTKKYIDLFNFPNGWDLEEVFHGILKKDSSLPEVFHKFFNIEYEEHLKNYETPSRVYKKHRIFVTSEKSKLLDDIKDDYDFKTMYYFFHGFAALDWYRGHRALNYNKTVVKEYKHDYQSFNRIVTGDRAYRKTFVDSLRQEDLLKHGAVSYGVTDDPVTEERLVIDHEQISGSASADIPRGIDAFWNIVTETVFYYDKLHLTEKIFKPIVSKQPFMLLAAPGNLEYLRSYGFKTFDGIIDESYDTIKDNDARIDSVVAQMKWYCNLSQEEKSRVIERLAPIVEYNFQHFYGKFKEIITDELLDNTKTLFKEIDYDDSQIDYATVRKLLTS